MPRANKTYSLDVDVIAALEKRAQEEGEPLSRLVERGIRKVLELPPEVREEGEEEISSTKNELVLRQMLKGSPVPGPYATSYLSNQAGITPGPCVRALKALERAGEVFCWGACHEIYGGGWDMAWSTMKPMDAIRRVLASWEPDTLPGAFHFLMLAPEEKRTPNYARLMLVRNLATCIDEIDQVRALLQEVTGFTDAQIALLDVRNEREVIAEKWEIERSGKNAPQPPTQG